MRKAKCYKGIDISNVTEGLPLPIDSAYVKRAWCLTYAAGIILLHMIVQKHSRESKSKELGDKADNLLIEASFKAIKNAQYESAEMILNYAHKLHLSSETAKLIIHINLAQTMKWIKREKECENLLKKYDWESSNTLFRLCVASLRGDYDLFKKLLPIVASEKRIKDSAMYEWPVFKEIRKNPDFNSLITKVFGVEKPSILSDLAPKVIDLQPERTLKALKSYMEDVLKIKESNIGIDIPSTPENKENDDLPISQSNEGSIIPQSSESKKPIHKIKKQKRKHKRK